MNKSIRNHWIATGVVAVGVMALTAGTRPSSTPPPDDLSAELTPTTFTNRTAAGMVSVKMQDLKDARLMGIRTRIALPGSDNLLPQGNGIPSSGSSLAMPTMPMMQQPDEEDDELGGLFDALDIDSSMETAGPSWGWLADDVNSLETPPVIQEPESGGFGFSSSGGARLDDRRENRLGTSQGFGTGGDDAFIFQRRRDERF